MVDISHEVGRRNEGALAYETADMESLFHPLADELMAVASRLRCVATAAPPALGSVTTRPSRNVRPSPGSLALARMIYALRRKRATIFGNADLFSEPAWDILLDLFIAQGEGKDVSVSSACIGSAAPPTTGLRWLGVLTDEGLVLRENDAEDNRRVLVRLTPAGLAAMERFFEAAEAGI